MKIQLVASAVEGDHDVQFLTSYRINDSLAIDAGSIGLAGDPAGQAQIRHVLISHTHIDHIASLPLLIDNTFEAGREALTVLGSPTVLEGLRRHVFNDQVWPDLVRLSRPGTSFLTFQTLEPGTTIELDGLEITPVAVDHLVPTLGFVVADRGASVVISSDTGPTEALWQTANTRSDLKGVFLEATFPDALGALATASGHLTPALFAQEVAKLASQPRLVAVHIKPRYRVQVVEELRALGLPNLEIGSPNVEYVF